MDGTDLRSRLVRLFHVLNTPEGERQPTLDAELAAFPYVNGGLFAGRLRTPSLTGAMRLELLGAARLDWSRVSPAIFGSMFQGVMDAAERRNLGAHYTSERNILRVIKPLFLDDLDAELDPGPDRRHGAGGAGVGHRDPRALTVHSMLDKHAHATAVASSGVSFTA